MADSERELQKSGHDAVRNQYVEAFSQVAINIEETRIRFSGKLHDKVRKLCTRIRKRTTKRKQTWNTQLARHEGCGSARTHLILYGEHPNQQRLYRSEVPNDQGTLAQDVHLPRTEPADDEGDLQQVRDNGKRQDQDHVIHEQRPRLGRDGAARHAYLAQQRPHQRHEVVRSATHTRRVDRRENDDLRYGARDEQRQGRHEDERRYPELLEEQPIAAPSPPLPLPLLPGCGRRRRRRRRRGCRRERALVHRPHDLDLQVLPDRRPEECDQAESGFRAGHGLGPADVELQLHAHEKRDEGEDVDEGVFRQPREPQERGSLRPDGHGEVPNHQDDDALDVRPEATEEHDDDGEEFRVAVPRVLDALNEAYAINAVPGVDRCEVELVAILDENSLVRNLGRVLVDCRIRHPGEAGARREFDRARRAALPAFRSGSILNAGVLCASRRGGGVREGETRQG
jgi:hypothetical protein